MQRADCFKALVPFIKDQLVIVSLGRSAEEWATICPRDGNLFDSGMGSHIPLALGLATVLPHRQVVVLDTDGSVLMLLSALTDVGVRPASNLKIFVFDNEVYERTGAQPSATAGAADLAAIAKGAGIPGTKTVRDMTSFKAAASEALTTEGLAFIVVKVEVATGPSPGGKMGHKESLIRFVRYIEATEHRSSSQVRHF